MKATDEDVDALMTLAVGGCVSAETGGRFRRLGWLAADGALTDDGLSALIAHEADEAVGELRWRLAQIVARAVDAGLVSERYAEDASGVPIETLRKMAADGEQQR